MDDFVLGLFLVLQPQHLQKTPGLFILRNIFSHIEQYTTIPDAYLCFIISLSLLQKFLQTKAINHHTYMKVYVYYPSNDSLNIAVTLANNVLY